VTDFEIFWSADGINPLPGTTAIFSIPKTYADTGGTLGFGADTVNAIKCDIPFKCLPMSRILIVF
jgi:hypothetical protein